MSDTSYTEKSPLSQPVSDSAKGESRKCYPKVVLNKEVSDKIGLPVDLVPGDKITATVVFVVTRVEKSDDEKEPYNSDGVTLSLEDIEPEDIKDSEKGGESSKDKFDEEKMLGYKRQSSSEKSKIKPPSKKDLESL